LVCVRVCVGVWVCVCVWARACVCACMCVARAWKRRVDTRRIQSMRYVLDINQSMHYVLDINQCMRYVLDINHPRDMTYAYVMHISVATP